MTTKQPDWEAIERACRAGLLFTIKPLGESMNRPCPPKGLGLFDEGDDYPISFATAPDVADGLFSTIMTPGELNTVQAAGHVRRTGRRPDQAQSE